MMIMRFAGSNPAEGIYNYIRGYNMNLTPNQKLELTGALKDMSNSFVRQSAERDLQKTVTTDICEELQLNKKVFRKI